MRAMRISFFLALCTLAGCASTQPCPTTTPAAESSLAATTAAMLDAQFGTERRHQPLESVMHEAALAPGETFKIVELARDANTSHHIVSLTGAEPLHRHDTHDLIVFVLQGEGNMLIGDEEHPIGAHSVVYIPRATVHSMRDTSSTPIVGYA